MYHLHGQIFFLWKKLKEKVSFWKLKFRECSVELLLSRDKWFLIFQSFDFHACISARHLYTLKLKEITYYSKAGNIYQQSFKSTELFLVIQYGIHIAVLIRIGVSGQKMVLRKITFSIWVTLQKWELFGRDFVHISFYSIYQL